LTPYLTRTIAPVSGPISLTEAKSFCDIQHDLKDADISAFIDTAAADVENYTGLALGVQTWVYRAGSWPACGRIVELERSPLVAVSSVKYYPSGGGAQATVSSADYYVATGKRPGFVEFKDTYSFPALAVRHDAVEITFTAGWSDVATIDPVLLHAVKLTVRELLDRPDTIITGTIVSEVPRLRNLLDSRRVRGVVAP